MKSFAIRISLVIAAVAAVLSAAPALALEETTAVVPNDCYAYGQQLQGLTATQAVAAINSAVRALPSVKISVDGVLFNFRPYAGVSVDASAMVEAAYEPTSAVGFTIAPSFTVNSTSITTWVQRVGKAVYVPAANARWYVKHSRMQVYRGRVGRRLMLNPVLFAVRSQVTSAAASGEVTTSVMPFARVVVTPAITVGKLPPAILTDLSERRIRLYARGRLWRSYGCAIGMPGYDTPTGTWRIVRKVMNPSWTNTGADWAVDMPDYIPPGPTNPLGTRALYLNATGIRIHGTTKRSSIGHAASHGCMRMLREDIEALYPLVPVGTTVYIIK